MVKIFKVFRKWLVIREDGKKCQENFLISAVNVMHFKLIILHLVLQTIFNLHTNIPFIILVG